MDPNTPGADKAIAVLRGLLSVFYEDEFVVIDGINQHPDGLTLDEWIDKHYKEALEEQESAGK
jgi:hypothetical protein